MNIFLKNPEEDWKRWFFPSNLQGWMFYFLLCEGEVLGWRFSIFFAYLMVQVPTGSYLIYYHWHRVLKYFKNKAQNQQPLNKILLKVLGRWVQLFFTILYIQNHNSCSICGVREYPVGKVPKIKSFKSFVTLLS